MEGTTEEEWAHKRMLRLLILAPEVTVEPDDESADQGMHWTENQMRNDKKIHTVIYDPFRRLRGKTALGANLMTREARPRRFGGRGRGREGAPGTQAG